MSPAAAVAERAQALQQRFEHIHATRMADVPVCHPGLQVAALGFEPDADGCGAVGVLLTPWFMNLVWLPLAPPAPPVPAASPQAAVAAPLAVGASRVRSVGHAAFEFIGAHEDGLGAFEACSLFSPMAEFEDQAAAVATALAVLDHLRQAPTGDTQAGDERADKPAPAEAVPPRRAFLLGAGGAGRAAR